MERLITLEEHYCSNLITERIAQKMEEAGNAEGAQQVRAMAGSSAPGVCDMAEERIAYMDAHGIDTQVISYASGIPATLPPERAIPLCHAVNDEMAANAAANPGRFACFAHLPLGDGEAAAAELERCVRELGFVGAMLSGHYRDLPYDDPLYLPIFEKAAELDVPIYLHPGLVSQNVRSHYYDGTWSDRLTFLFAGFGMGWHYDVGIQIMRLILTGTFDKLPNLKIICGHWGELVAYYMYRADEMGKEATGLELNVSDYFKRNIYVNPSGMLYAENMRFCLDTFGPDHIMWGEDYPYRQCENIRSFLEEADIDDETREKIAHGNAERILGI